MRAIDVLFSFVFGVMGICFIFMGVLMAVGVLHPFNPWSDVLGVVGGLMLLGLSWSINQPWYSTH
jgi:hypothetical protein